MHLTVKFFRISIDCSMGGQGFDSQAIQTGHSAPTARHLSDVSSPCLRGSKLCRPGA